MDLITLDFETLYGDDYTLSKMTTEEYIRDDRFEAIMMGYRINADRPHYVVGFDKIKAWLDTAKVEQRAVLCHHAHFDGLILRHHFGHTPKVWFDTLSMARGLGFDKCSLSALMEYYGVGHKGIEVLNAKGKRLADFTPTELAAYGKYCMNDVVGTYDIFERMVAEFPKKELQIIDMVVRMFTEPELLLDTAMLENYAQEIQANKMTMLIEAGVTLDEVMSNDKFAEALKRVGVNPPTKISPTTGKKAWAFAKTDKGLVDLQEHPDEQVQALIAARLGNKTTINETRALRMAGMSTRGPACVYLNYSGAKQTHRLSGGDKMNWQNFTRGSPLRKAVIAPPGYEFVVVDSSNIEARILDWLAMQDDMVQAYRDYDAGVGPDIYCVMAEKLYGYPINKKEHPKERQLGKTVKLGCGYQMGSERFQETARIIGKLTLSLNDATRAVETYRAHHPMVKVLWNRGQNALPAFLSGPDGDKGLDPRGVLQIEKGALLLPNGLRIRYPDLSYSKEGWSFRSNRGERTNLYGGKVVENAVQALARIVVLEQTLEIHKHTPCRMSVHDEGVFLVPAGAGNEWLAYAKEVMSTPPAWAPDLPVAASGGIATRYGEVDK